MEHVEEKYVSKQRRPSKKELLVILVNKFQAAVDSGASFEEAAGMLTQRQYDFLEDNGVKLGDLALNATQKESLKNMLRAKRPTFPGGYNKKYPDIVKNEFYNNLVEFVKAQGAEVIPREKINYRDLDFTINGKKYRIVFSAPTKT